MNALKYAIKVIENYEMDIRAAIADGLLPAGYCQGIIYKEAIADIERQAEAATEHQILALSAIDEGWRVNKDTEEWFAEKPCWKAGIPETDRDIMNRCYECGDTEIHCRHCCGGTLFVRAGRKT